MKYYPVNLDLRERLCVVVGGGRVAERKTLSLLEAGAEVKVVSPTLTPKLADLAASGKVLRVPLPFHETHLAGAHLVIAATNDLAVNHAVAQFCRKKGILVNVAAPPEESSFIVPSVVERGNLVIAVSTNGASPALSRNIRQELEKQYGPEYDLLLTRLAAVRKRLQEEVGSETIRRQVLEAIIGSGVLDLLRKGKLHEADHLIGELLKQHAGP
jgi:precorrin-2 dehydrogenase / sirohydrochlorin ferrochelatase